MTRLRQVFARPGKKLVAYLTAGDPDRATSLEVILGTARAGADVIELGVPFSDPSADGPAIQAAMARALAAGASLPGTIDLVRDVRARGCDVPIVLFGYFNPLFVHGLPRFCAEAATAGADGVLVVDLPVDEIAELSEPASKAGLDVVPLLAPTSSEARIRRVAALDAPFVYYVSMTGITGAELRGKDELPARLAALKQLVQAPVAVGFGIATPADAGAMARIADAVVVGSAIVKRPPAEIPAFVAELAAAVHG